MGDEAARLEYKAALAAMQNCNWKDAYMALFGQEPGGLDNTWPLKNNPGGVISKLVKAQIEANEISRNTALAAYNEAREKFSTLAADIDCNCILEEAI